MWNRSSMLFYIQLRYVLLGWYDVHNSGDFATKITDDLDKLQVNLIFARFRTLNVHVFLKMQYNWFCSKKLKKYATNQREIWDNGLFISLVLKVLW